MQDTGETIKGAIYFDGDGIRKDHEETAPFRTVFLGKYEFEVSEAGIVSVSDAMISEEAFNRLSDPDYCYTVNVFSGRRVFKDNILDGGYAGGHINDAVTTRIEINCDLIEK